MKTATLIAIGALSGCTTTRVAIDRMLAPSRCEALEARIEVFEDCAALEGCFPNVDDFRRYRNTQREMEALGCGLEP